jgi:hypothetical protein
MGQRGWSRVTRESNRGSDKSVWQRRFGASLVNPAQTVSPGSVGVFDTGTGCFEYITNPWLDQIQGDDIDLKALLAPTGA